MFLVPSLQDPVLLKLLFGLKILVAGPVTRVVLNLSMSGVRFSLVLRKG